MAQQRLELTWVNKDKALIPTEHGRYGYTWVDPRDPRYCEIRPLILDGEVQGEQAPIRQILEAAASEVPPREELEPIRLNTVRTPGGSTWSRENLYDDAGR